METRVTRCRMLRRRGDQCTAEALDEMGEVLICLEHAALVIELISRAGDGVTGLLAALAGKEGRSDD